MGHDFNLNIPDSHSNSPKFTFTFYGLGPVACFNYKLTSEIISIIIIIIIYCNWVVTRWQWLFHMYTKHEIGYY